MKHIGLKIRMAVVGAILAGFYLVVVAFAMVAYGTSIWPIAIAGSVLLVGFQYKVGKWAALRSVGAEDLSEDQYPQIHQQVRQLSRDMGIEKPKLKVARMGVPNAFAVGRKGAGVVVVSTELMALLDDDELEGVLAHELAHIANRDVVTMVIGQGIASIVGIAAQMVVFATGDNDIADFFLAIIVGNIVQFFVMLFVLAISRYREYVADADAKEAIGGGDPLARALEKISGGHQRSRESAVDSQVSALCIFGDSDSFLSKIVSTHPPTEKRIERLRS
ncbi:M48 family metalloprotease [Halomicroarcula sp. F28]|uniref:M48 family metalloprotease n=2 Tax=Haloarcula salinisoli TaxID=2487746 RepID=A0A8J7YHY9_9EURY|nr:M48 family metalloprotease [Halomicroarcula salinisoli]MBX0288356.1 M48 family metalloprotease [Halomicroarcula salinisoli]MBX0305837.1 M48 family metalloprotease [Halomicroarcula salinisoli]